MALIKVVTIYSEQGNTLKKVYVLGIQVYTSVISEDNRLNLDDELKR